MSFSISALDSLWSEGMPRFEGIETSYLLLLERHKLLSEGMPRFEGIETRIFMTIK